MDDWIPGSDAVPGIKPIGKTHRKVESKYVRVSTCAEDEGHGSDENEGERGGKQPTSNLKGRPKIKMHCARM